MAVNYKITTEEDSNCGCNSALQALMSGKYDLDLTIAENLAITFASIDKCEDEIDPDQIDVIERMAELSLLVDRIIKTYDVDNCGTCGPFIVNVSSNG